MVSEYRTLVLAGVLAMTTVAHADDPPLRLGACVGSPEDERLVERLRGQLSDVSVELESVPGACDAERIAREHAFDAVMWFEPRAEPSGQLLVQLWAAGRGTLPPRAVAAQTGARSSDVLEAAALVARSSVVALAVAGPPPAPPSAAGPQPTPAVVGAPIAPPPPAATPVPVPAPEPEPDPADDKPTLVDTPEAPSTPLLLTPRFFVGLQSVIDGVSDLGQHALAVRFGLMLESIVFSVYGSASLGSGVTDPFVDLRLTRHGAGVAVDLEQRLWGDIHGAAGLHAGATFYLRSSVPKTDDVAKTGTKFVAALAFGPELALEYRPASFGIGLHLALDIVPAAPTFRLATPEGGVRTAHAVWILEPRAGLGLEGRL